MSKSADTLISCIYDAAANECLWPELLSSLIDEFEAVGATYFIFEKNSRQQCYWCNVGHDVAKERSYTDYYINVDPTLELALRSDVGALLNSNDHFSKRYIEKNEYFQDFLIPSRLGDVAGAKIIDQNDVVGMFSIQHDLNRQSISDKHRALLTEILPHLVRAAKIHWGYKNLEIATQGITDALTRSPQAMIVIDNNRAVQYMNSAAESLISCGCGIRIHGGVLCCVDIEQEKKLQSATANATSTVPGSVKSGFIQLVRGSMQVFLNVVPVSSSLSPSNWGSRHALVMASPPIPTEEAFYKFIGDEFLFTKAEKILAFRLFSGGTLTDIAQELGLSRETLRCQLRSIFVKTGTNRQSQLLDLMRQVSACLPSKVLFYK